MSTTREAWEEDKEWLETELQKINIKPSETIIERFCERVAIGICCNLMSIREARHSALSELVK